MGLRGLLSYLNSPKHKEAMAKANTRIPMTQLNGETLAVDVSVWCGLSVLCSVSFMRIMLHYAVVVAGCTAGAPRFCPSCQRYKP